MDYYELTNTASTPTPHTFTYEEANALSTQLHRSGVRFFLRDDTDHEEMTYPTLEHCVRHGDDFDTDGYSDAELWSDVIAPAIVDGRIEYAVWGVVQNVQS